MYSLRCNQTSTYANKTRKKKETSASLSTAVKFNIVVTISTKLIKEASGKIQEHRYNCFYLTAKAFY